MRKDRKERKERRKEKHTGGRYSEHPTTPFQDHQWDMTLIEEDKQQSIVHIGKMDLALDK